MIWAVVAGASLIAGIIQTVTGFGSVVFLMMVLPFYFDMIDAPTLAIVTNQLFCMALCWKYRKYIRWRLALPPTLAFGAANLLTLPFVNGLDLHVLARVFAVFLMALAVYFLVVARRMCIRAPKPAAGVVCGALCGVSAGFSARSSVDLPPPDGPITVRNSPSSTENETSRRAGTVSCG